MGKNKLTDIILIEDDNSFAESLRDICLEYRLNVKHLNNATDGLNELKMRKSKYKGIILDIKCPINEGEIEKEGQLQFILEKIKQFEDEIGRIIPKVICTGNMDYYLAHKEGIDLHNVKGFRKDDLESMLDQLKKQINNSEIMKLQKDFPDIFNIIDKKHFTTKDNKSPRDDIENKLLGLLNSIKTSNPVEFQNLKSSIRVFLEAIFIQMNIANKNKVPENILYKSEIKSQINIMGVIEHLKQDKSNPRIITTLMTGLQLNSNANGSHLSEHPTSKYFFRGQVYMLLEILLWFDQWMDNNN